MTGVAKWKNLLQKCSCDWSASEEVVDETISSAMRKIANLGKEEFCWFQRLEAAKKKRLKNVRDTSNTICDECWSDAPVILVDSKLAKVDGRCSSCGHRSAPPENMQRSKILPLPKKELTPAYVSWKFAETALKGGNLRLTSAFERMSQHVKSFLAQLVPTVVDVSRTSSTRLDLS